MQKQLGESICFLFNQMLIFGKKKKKAKLLSFSLIFLKSYFFIENDICVNI